MTRRAEQATSPGDIRTVRAVLLNGGIGLVLVPPVGVALRWLASNGLSRRDVLSTALAYVVMVVASTSGLAVRAYLRRRNRGANALHDA